MNGKHLKKKKKISGWLIAFFVLIGITILLCATAAGIWLHGRNAMTPEVVAPVLPIQKPEDNANSPVEDTDTQAPDESVVDDLTIFYNGKLYRYKENLCNILAIGVDGDSKPEIIDENSESYQSDVIILAALDMDANEVTLISISRDTMCDIVVYDKDGNSGVMTQQLALSYAYGDGLEESCELCRDAVSKLFFGLQIHGYGAYYMGGVAELNDAVGGVPVTILDDYPFSKERGCRNMKAGETVTLFGEQARYYIQKRMWTESGNSNRMIRQKQYLYSFISQAKKVIKNDPTKIVNIYNDVTDYTVTDLSIDKLSYLATEVVDMHISEDIRSLSGDLIVGENNLMEFYPDNDALIELMLDVFYEEVKN